MKILFYNNTKGATTYTYELLKTIAKYYKHEIVQNNPDIIAISLTSHYEIEELRKLRKKTNKPIVVGGHCSNAPLSLLRYASYVNLGAGFDFFKNCKKISDIEKQDFIISKNKLEGVFSQYINWDILPIVQISKNSYSYLESVGCKHKCKFCLTSWINKHQVTEKQNILKRVSEKFKNKQLYFIGNNYESISCNLNVSDVTIKGYNEKYTNYENIKLIRAGLESPLEKTRKELSKNIKDIDIKKFFHITSINKKRANIFFIAGLNSQEEWESFIDILPSDINSSPSIGIVINYFDPSMGTPLARYNLNDIIPINIPRIKRIWKLHNSRIVIFRDLKISWKNSTFGSLLQRCNYIEIDNLLQLRKNKYNTFKDMINTLNKHGYNKLIDGSFKYECELINWHGLNYW